MRLAHDTRALASSARSRFDLRYLATIAGVALLYFAAAKLGLSLAFATKEVSAVWPPIGLAFVVYVLLGYRVWPGVYLGAFLANATLNEPLVTAAGIAVGNTLAGITGLYLMRRFLGFERSFERTKDVLGLIVFGAAVGATVSATNGVTHLAAAHLISWSDYGSVWWVWWVGDAMGVLLVAPLLLTWNARPRLEWQGGRLVELSVLFLLLTATCCLTFLTGVVSPSPLWRLEYTVFPLIIWTAVRFGQREAASAVALISSIAIWGTIHERGPFSVGTPDQRLILLELFMAVAAVTAFMLGAVTAERKHAVSSLQRAHDELEERVQERTSVLRSEQARLAAAEQLAHLGSWEWNIGSDEVSWSDELYRIFGLKKSSSGISMASCLTRVHPEDRARVEELLRKAARTGERFVSEERILRPDGTLRFLHATGEVLFDASGAPSRLRATCQDITERKQAEDALHRQRLLYESLLRAQSEIGEGVALTEGERIVYANEALANLGGYSVEELCALPSFLDVVPPDERLRLVERLQLRLAGEAVDDNEAVVLRKDGTRLHIQYAAKPVNIGDKVQVFSLIRDITHHKKTEEKFRQLLEAAPDAMVITAEGGAIELVNAQTEKLFGYSRTELIGQRVEMLMPQRYRGVHPGHRERYYREPRARPMGSGLDLFGRRKDGTEFPVEISLSPLQLEGGSLISSSIRDITSQKETQRTIEKSLREKEILLKEIHHRVKNNLQIISSLLNLRGRHVESAQGRAVLVESKTRVHAIALVHEKLYGARDLASIDFDSYLKSLTLGLLRAFGARCATIDVSARHVELGIDVAIPCGLIVNELVTNSLKHAFPGDRTGRVAVSLGETERQQLLLEVSDDGIGIPEEIDFRSATSMGLQLVCSLTKQLRGEIDLDRSHGTHFYVRFPRSD